MTAFASTHSRQTGIEGHFHYYSWRNSFKYSTAKWTQALHVGSVLASYSGLKKRNAEMHWLFLSHSESDSSQYTGIMKGFLDWWLKHMACFLNLKGVMEKKNHTGMGKICAKIKQMVAPFREKEALPVVLHDAVLSSEC